MSSTSHCSSLDFLRNRPHPSCASNINYLDNIESLISYRSLHHKCDPIKQINADFTVRSTFSLNQLQMTNVGTGSQANLK